MRTGLLLTMVAVLTHPAIAAGLDHAAWDQLLKRYVTAQSRVDYARWKADGADSLDGYLSVLAQPLPSSLSPAAKKAASINAYNALMVRWILRNYPVASVWRTQKPFVTLRHTLNGEKVSLDMIENRLRDLGDPRVHAVLVCAARSCPPLRREAYDESRLDEQMDGNARAWLANKELNDFRPEKRQANVSSIFKWFRQDFERNGQSVQQFLAKYTPPDEAAFVRQGHVTLSYKTYHWGLNDTSPLGADYGQAAFLWDHLRNR
jgi:hypothetical protein